MRWERLVDCVEGLAFYAAVACLAVLVAGGLGGWLDALMRVGVP